MGHFQEGYRLKCKSPRSKSNVPNISPLGTSNEKDQMEVVVSPPPVSSYTLPRGPESPPGVQSIMYSPRSVVDSAINPCHVQIKTEQEAVNFSSNRNFRCARKETHLSPRFVTNGARAPPDYTLSSKLGLSQAFTMSPSEKKNSPMNVTNGSNPEGYLFGKALESSMENLMKFAEVLYKCTLCTTLPSILTSRDSFISHVNDLHLTKKQSHKECQHCNLKFSTEEDLRAHCRFSHGMGTHPGDEVEPTEPSPIDEFTNKSETEISTENQCTVGDPTKTIQSRTPRFIMESVHAKQRPAAIVPSSPLIRVTNSSSPGKETVKSEKVSMEENISRLQQLADQILISNSRLSSGGAGAAGTPSGFHGATSNPSYTPDFGKYTKLIREGGNIVYFCQVCNCKCQVRAAFMSHCSSYQHRARVEAADRSVTPDHSPVQAQSQQSPPNQSTQPPPPAHSHPHSQRHQQNSHSPYHHQQSHQLLLTQSNFKRDHLSCSSSSSSVSSHLIGSSVSNSSSSSSSSSTNTSTSNNNNNKSNTSANSNCSNSSTSSNIKKTTHYSGKTSSSSPTLNPSTSSASTFTNTTSPSATNTTNTSLSSAPPSPISTTEASQASKSVSQDRSVVASPGAVRTTPVGPTVKASAPMASPTPDHPHEGSPTPGPPSEPASDCELEKDGQRKRPRVDMSSDGDSNCDREVTTRQRRKRHAPVAVRQPQVTTSWSDSDSEEETVCTKSRKKSSEGESEEEDNNHNKNDSNNNNNDDDNTGSTSTSSSNSSSSSNNSSSDNSHKGSSSSNTSSSSSSSGRDSSNNTSNNTIQSSTDTGTNTKTDDEHPQPCDKATNEDVDSQPKGSPDTGRKTPHSPSQSSPAPTRVPTPENSPQKTNETPVDFSMTDANCSLPQNTDSLGMLSSVVEGILVSENQPPVLFGSFDKSQVVNSLVSIKTEPEERADSDSGGLRGIYRCSFCDFVGYDIRDYEEHFVKEHDPDLLDVTLTDASGKTVHGEYWKMLKIKDILPELLVGCAKGYVSRDILLQKISLLLNIPEVVHWGPACNKAVREEFPNSLAQRKGKFKKTYYFGVALIEQLQEQEELSDSENVTYQPLRDLAQDLEKILQFLPELVFWTGDLDVGISRDEVLQLLGEKIEESGVQYWGVQCNRAMRFLFPSIHMKRKGKFKTVYFGVDFMKNITRQIPQTFDSDQTVFIKSEPLDDSYDSVEPKSLHPEMACAIFPTSIPLVVSTSPSSTATAVTTRSYSTGIE